MTFQSSLLSEVRMKIMTIISTIKERCITHTGWGILRQGLGGWLSGKKSEVGKRGERKGKKERGKERERKRTEYTGIL